MTITVDGKPLQTNASLYCYIDRAFGAKMQDHRSRFDVEHISVYCVSAYKVRVL